MQVIQFDKIGEYKQFSNFYVKSITVDNISYPSVEHYYQSMKFCNNPKYFEYIRNAKTPYRAYCLGKQKLTNSRGKDVETDTIINEYKNLIKPIDNWDNIKDSVMEKALRVKFNDVKLKELLLSTKGKILEEINPYDEYWAIGKNGTGLNKLGKLLITIRDENN